MNVGASSGAAESPIQVLSRKLPPDASIHQIRGMLLAGYGKGASESMITAVTRDRLVIGGIATSTRRARLAQRTVQAREAPSGLLSRLVRGVRNLVVIGAGLVIALGLVNVLRRDERKLRKKKHSRS